MRTAGFLPFVARLKQAPGSGGTNYRHDMSFGLQRVLQRRCSTFQPMSQCHLGYNGVRLSYNGRHLSYNATCISVHVYSLTGCLSIGEGAD